MIRKALAIDAPAIRTLIGELGYEHSEDFIKAKLEHLMNSSSDEVFVYLVDNRVVGLISLHFAVQLAFDGDIMSIGYFVVDENSRGLQIGKQLEEYAVRVARDRGCCLIEVFSQAKRLDAHRFYKRQGYQVTECFFSKEL